MKKTFLVAPDVAFATTGAHGLGQRLGSILEALRPHPELDWANHPALDIALQISTNMLQNMQRTFLQPGQVGALGSYASGGTFHLCEFDMETFQPELKSNDSLFVSMGSGQLITAPFFGLLRRTLFRDSRPTLQEGVLVAYWALFNAIELNTGGINEPTQLATLRRSSPTAPFFTRLVTNEEIKEYKLAVRDDLEEYLAAARPRLSPATIPKMP